MKITKTRLRTLIREAISKQLNEAREVSLEQLGAAFAAGSLTKMGVESLMQALRQMSNNDRKKLMSALKKAERLDKENAYKVGMDKKISGLNPKKVSKQIAKSMKTFDWDWVRDRYDEVDESIKLAMVRCFGEGWGEMFSNALFHYAPPHGDVFRKYSDQEIVEAQDKAEEVLKEIVRDLLTV